MAAWRWRGAVAEVAGWVGGVGDALEPGDAKYGGDVV
jgi:hypothetical protein